MHFNLLVMLPLEKCHEQHSTHDAKLMKMHQFAFVLNPAPCLNVQLTLTLEVPIVTNSNFLLTIYIHTLS